MGCYVIAVGGTGNKILESVVYAACADAFYTLDAQGQSVPIPRLNLLSVDVDAACGNTTRAQRAAEAYQDVRGAFSHSTVQHRCFHTDLSISRWNMNLSRRAASVQKMAQNNGCDRLLARTLFTPAEARLEYSEGFRGHPDLGVLFFAELLDSLEETRRQGLPDEFNELMDRMQAELDRGEEVRVMLCGSIFGGTGASGIPALSKYLRRRFQAFSQQFILGSVLMLPYYSVPASDADENQEIVVRSDTFLDKARTALQYYGMEGMLRSSETDERGVYDAVYLLGLPPEYFVTARLYSTGSQSQENDAHLLEWLAARDIAAFMRTSFRGEGCANMDCYYTQWHTPHLCWNSFDQEALLYRDRYGALMKAAAVFFSECCPTLRGCLAGERRCLRVGYCAPYFSRRISASQRAEAERQLDSLYRFWAFYAGWMRQLLGQLPPGMAHETDGLFSLKLLDELQALLQSECTDTRRSVALQKGLHRLILGSVPDRRDIRSVICGLGGAGGEGLAAFVTVLLDTVLEPM